MQVLSVLKSKIKRRVRRPYNIPVSIMRLREIADPAEPAFSAGAFSFIALGKFGADCWRV